MGTSKHVRKTGATTVTKDGKIVGNIGRGKTVVPQPQPNAVEHSQPASEDNTFIQVAQNKFMQLQTEPQPSSDTVATIWNLTSGLPYPQRLETIVNLYNHMSEEEKNQFFDTCLSTEILPIFDPERNYSKMMDALDPSITMSPDVYAMLADHPDCFIRQSVTTNPNTSQDILAAHVDDIDHRIRTEIAARLSFTYTEEISKLATTQSEDIHEALLERKDLPHNVISEIYDNATTYTKIHIARHKNTPQKILENIYAENEEAQKNSPWGADLLLGLAKNPHTPIPILVELCKHSSDKNHYGVTIGYKISEQAQVTLLKLRKNDPNRSFTSTATGEGN